jgi:hypothetical protein
MERLVTRPSFQFYPADWRSNAKLRRCSEAGRGAWMDILCALHDSDEYGVLRWPLADVARAAGVPLKLARELVTKGVLKGDDSAAPDYIYTPRHAGKAGEPVTLVDAAGGPCWYCSRLVRDEWVRQRRGKGTQFTEDNQPPKGAPKPTFGDAKSSDTSEKNLHLFDEKNSFDALHNKCTENGGNPHEHSVSGSPKGGIGGGFGDGPSSSSSSSSKSITPIPPSGVALHPIEKTKKKNAIALQTFIDDCTRNGERPMRDYAPLWAYAKSAGLDPDFIALAWVEFCRRFLPGGTDEARRYKDWRIAFRNHVEKGWLKLWAIDKDGTYFLTSQGKQVQKVHDTKEAA